MAGSFSRKHASKRKSGQRNGARLLFHWRMHSKTLKTTKPALRRLFTDLSHFGNIANMLFHSIHFISNSRRVYKKERYQVDFELFRTKIWFYQTS